MNGALVVLNGYPGVGKTAIANELLQLFPNSRIVDVRFLDKLASGIHPVGSPENMNLRKSLRQTTLKSLVPSDDNLIRAPSATFNPNAKFYGASNIPAQSETGHLCPPIYIFPESLYASTHANLLDIKPKFCAANGFTLLSVVLPLDTESHVMRAGKKGYKEDDIIEVRMCEEIGYFNTPRARICREWEVVTDGLPIDRAGTRVAEYILDGLRDAGWFVQLQTRVRTAPNEEEEVIEGIFNEGERARERRIGQPGRKDEKDSSHRHNYLERQHYFIIPSFISQGPQSQMYMR